MVANRGFKEKIKNWWDSFNSIGNPDFVLMKKMKSLKTKLKEGRKSIQGNLGLQK